MSRLLPAALRRHLTAEARGSRGYIVALLLLVAGCAILGALSWMLAQ